MSWWELALEKLVVLWWHARGRAWALFLYGKVRQWGASALGNPHWPKNVLEMARRMGLTPKDAITALIKADVL